MKTFPHNSVSASGKSGGRVALVAGDVQVVRSAPVKRHQRKPSQQASRSAFASLQDHWKSTLTDAQRAGWSRVPPPRDGRAAFLAANLTAARDPFAGTVIFDPPPDFRHPPLGAWIVFQASTVLWVRWTVPDYYDGLADTYLRIDVSRPAKPSILRYTGPYGRFSSVQGTQSGGSNINLGIGFAALPWPVAVGQRVFVRARVRDGSARLSTPWTATVVRVP